MKAQKNGLNCKRRIAGAVALGSLGLFVAQPAVAVRFEGESVSGSFDSTISIGVQGRASSTSCRIIGNDNGGCTPDVGRLGEVVNGPGGGSSSSPNFNFLQSDDGNLNFKKNDITSFALKGTHELFLKMPANVTTLLRGTWLGDSQADNTRSTSLSNDAKDLAVHNFTLLDAWVAKEFDVGDRRAKVKVGNQVISWGEDVFIYGGINITNAIDLRKFHTPGVQLKEVFRPAPIASINLGLTDNLSLEAYYQWKWNGFRFDPVGTFFSGADVVGRGAGPAFITNSLASGFGFGPCGDRNTINTATSRKFTNTELAANGCLVPRGATNDPKDSGQFGFAARFKPDSINAEFGAYAIRYHDKIPFIGFVVDGNPNNAFGLKYFEDFGENRWVYGLSTNTQVGPVAVGAEISYRPKDSVGIDPTVPATGKFAAFDPANAGVPVRGFVTEQKWQAHLTGFYLIAPSSPLGRIMTGLGAAEGFILAEAAVTRYPKLDFSGAVPYLLLNDELPNKTSWGYVISTGITYPHVWSSGWNMTPQIDFSHDVNGTAPNAIPFVEGRKAATLSLNFDRDSRWKVNIGATQFWGGGSNNLLRDRDIVFASVSHSF